MTEPKQHRLQTSIQIPLHTRSMFHERVYCLWGRLVYGLLLVGPQYFFLFQGYLLFDSRVNCLLGPTRLLRLAGHARADKSAWMSMLLTFVVHLPRIQQSYWTLYARLSYHDRRKVVKFLRMTSYSSLWHRKFVLMAVIWCLCWNDSFGRQKATAAEHTEQPTQPRVHSAFNKSAGNGGKKTQDESEFALQQPVQQSGNMPSY